jgi:hypothetical protein
MNLAEIKISGSGLVDQVANFEQALANLCSTVYLLGQGEKYNEIKEAVCRLRESTGFSGVQIIQKINSLCLEGLSVDQAVETLKERMSR